MDIKIFLTPVKGANRADEIVTQTEEYPDEKPQLSSHKLPGALNLSKGRIIEKLEPVWKGNKIPENPEYLPQIYLEVISRATRVDEIVPPNGGTVHLKQNLDDLIANPNSDIATIYDTQILHLLARFSKALEEFKAHRCEVNNGGYFRKTEYGLEINYWGNTPEKKGAENEIKKTSINQTNQRFNRNN